MTRSRCGGRARRPAVLALLVLAAVLAAPPVPVRAQETRSFDIPAGDAGESVRLFAQQAGAEIMFLSGSLAGVGTRGIRGQFTAGDALDRMLAGTNLAGTRDGPTGAFAITRREKGDRVIRLPPYLVTDTANPIRWRYAAMPGFEILSSCRDTETEEFAREIHRQQAWLDELVPPGLRAVPTVPTALIAFGDEARGSMSANLARLAWENEVRVRRSLVQGGVGVPPPTPELMTQVKLWDEDSTSVGIVLGYPEPGRGGSLGYEPDYVFFTLARRAPPLPAWFIDGVVRLYGTRVATDRAAHAGGSFRVGRNRVDVPGGDRLLSVNQVFSPADWVEPGVTELLRDRPSAPRRLIPLRELLFEAPPSASADTEKERWFRAAGAQSRARLILEHGADPGSPWRREIWRSETLLFVRWALDDDSFALRRSLWSLADRAADGPADAGTFMSCFGMSTEEADRMLDAYLGDAVAQPLKLVPQAPVEFPWVEPRDATDAEQARILGDWERKELEFVRASHDEFAAGYASQAERTFMGAYERGERDPELLAAIGIYRCALGETGAARALLEEAVRGGTARPRAYVELARLRLGEALEKPAGSGGTLDPGQVSSILGLVRAGRDRLPPQHAAYAEAAEVLEHAQAAPTRADLILLAEGLRLFPRDAALALAVARLRAAAGENR